MSVWSNKVGWMAPSVISALIAGPRSAVIQSSSAGLRSSLIRALVIIPRSPTRATWASPKRSLSLVTWLARVAGSPVAPLNTSTATGDPARFATGRALAWHAGLCPRENASGAAQGKTSISGRGRPGLRLAAWRAVWAAMPNNPVMAARFAYLTTRQDNRLARQQARTVCAAALLRWIHVVVTRRVTWDPAIAAGGTPLRQAA